MREYIYSLMTDRRRGFIPGLIKGLLAFISFFYGLLVKIIRPMRMMGAENLPSKVVSIGNLTLGGTGKTPTACMLAKSLKEEGKNPSVLIRGYGDDEWKMLKNLLGDIPVIVGKDRIAGGKKAVSEFNTDAIILDDGFQHWRLKRDLDIVLIDSTNPFGNRCLFPRGILREDIRELRRADIIMLTKTDMAKEALNDIKDEIRKIVPDRAILESVHSPLWFYELEEKKRFGLSFIKGKSICSLSSIVNTEYFEFVLKNLGANIVSSFHYPDHYNYKRKDLESIIDECKRRKIDTVVTTEKDAAKLTAIKKLPAVIASEVLSEAKGEAKQSRTSQSEEESEESRPGLNLAYFLHRNDGEETFAPRNDRNQLHICILVLHVELKVTDGQDTLRRRLHSLYSA